MKNNVKYYGIIQFALLLISYIFINKTIYLAPNLNFNVGLIIYAFTFLFLIFGYNKNNLKYAKSIIYKSLLVFFIFYIIVIVLNSLPSIPEANIITESLRNIFTPNYFQIKNIVIYYPNFNIIIYMLVYYLTHYIFVAIYEAIESGSNYLIAFILSILISFILDQIIYVPLSNIFNLFNNSITYKTLIEMMTANFIIVIFVSVIISMVYLILKNRYQTKNLKK